MHIKMLIKMLDGVCVEDEEDEYLASGDYDEHGVHRRIIE